MPRLNRARAVLSKTYTLIIRLGQIVFAPWPSTYEPVKSLLNAPSEAEKDQLTATWRDKKLGELSFVGITCGLIASVISGAFSWRPAEQVPWATAGLWYGGLLMTLTSICLATQQGVALNRISGHANSLERLRAMLGTDSSPASTSTMPHWDQLYVWQTPIMLLNVSVILFIVGLIIMVFDELARNLWSERSIKVIILVTVGGAFSGLNYLACTLLLYRRSV